MAKLKMRTSNGWKEISGLNGKDGFWFQGLPNNVVFRVDSNGNFYNDNQLRFTGYLMQGSKVVKPICSDQGGNSTISWVYYEDPLTGLITIDFEPTDSTGDTVVVPIWAVYEGVSYVHNIVVQIIRDGINATIQVNTWEDDD